MQKIYRVTAVNEQGRIVHRSFQTAENGKQAIDNVEDYYISADTEYKSISAQKVADLNSEV